MAGCRERVPGSAATILAAATGKIETEFLSPALNKVSAGLLSHRICLLGEKQEPEFNYLLFLVQLWVITVEPGGPSAMCGDVIPAPGRKKGWFEQAVRDRDWAVLGDGDNTGAIHFWRSYESRGCCHCPPTANTPFSMLAQLGAKDLPWARL